MSAPLRKCFPSDASLIPSFTVLDPFVKEGKLHYLMCTMKVSTRVPPRCRGQPSAAVGLMNLFCPQTQSDPDFSIFYADGKRSTVAGVRFCGNNAPAGWPDAKLAWPAAAAAAAAVEEADIPNSPVGPALSGLARPTRSKKRAINYAELPVVR